jgi:gamma-glutamyltranspeptidase
MLVEGDWVKRIAYSKTLAYIARHGIDAFYGHGSDPWIARAMVDAVEKEDGVLSIEDLQGYDVQVYDPVNTTYHGNVVYTTDAPSCGKPAPLPPPDLLIVRDTNFTHMLQDR